MRLEDGRNLKASYLLDAAKNRLELVVVLDNLFARLSGKIVQKLVARFAYVQDLHRPVFGFQKPEELLYTVALLEQVGIQSFCELKGLAAQQFEKFSSPLRFRKPRIPLEDLDFALRIAKRRVNTVTCRDVLSHCARAIVVLPRAQRSERGFVRSLSVRTAGAERASEARSFVPGTVLLSSFILT